MSLRERISELRRAGRAAPQPDDLRPLEARLKHLETLVEGLQDAIYRDSVRQDERMAGLERKTEPEALAKALSDDARRRGL
jgi:hypothetical protein